jgi:hypothetical protein
MMVPFYLVGRDECIVIGQQNTDVEVVAKRKSGVALRFEVRNSPEYFSPSSDKLFLPNRTTASVFIKCQEDSGACQKLVLFFVS